MSTNVGSASVVSGGVATTKRGGQRQQQRLKTRAAILDAALAEFAEHGYAGANLRAISSRVGINHALIRHYFTNKDNLWKSAVAFLFERMEKELEADVSTFDGDDEFGRLKHGIRAYVRYCAKYPEHARLMMQQSISGGERLTWAVERFIKPQHRGTDSDRQQYKDGGLWPDISDISSIYILVAVAQIPFLLAGEIKLIYGTDMFNAKHVDEHVDAIIEFFFRHSVADT